MADLPLLERVKLAIWCDHVPSVTVVQRKWRKEFHKDRHAPAPTSRTIKNVHKRLLETGSVAGGKKGRVKGEIRPVRTAENTAAVQQLFMENQKGVSAVEDVR